MPDTTATNANVARLQYPDSSSLDTPLPIDAFAFDNSQPPFPDSADWWLPQTDATLDPSWSHADSTSLNSSLISSGAPHIDTDNLLGQLDFDSLASVPQPSVNNNPQSSNNPTPSLYDRSDSSSRHSSPQSPPATHTSTPKPSSAPPSRIEKRKLNTLAARRYRQKRVDQMSSLESALKEVERERDALKVRVAKLEGETEILKQLLSKKN
ncbi:bZIP transcription factor protein [Rutstroemia sp. NJR-2017a BBW]|nr:bZIP transcription factor protein [Rutstroemia sp. NJR-2017a BBW]